jgi:Domain of unknown function (DUF6438)/Gram-negative bacterial TonB protein C-terminal
LCALAQAPHEPVLKSHGSLVYPPMARTGRVSGSVTVGFKINVLGETTAVDAIDGPAMLRKSAEEFVKSWIFDVSQRGVNAQESYQTTIDFRAVVGRVDPRLDQNPKIISSGFQHFEIKILVSDIKASDCPTGAEEDVPLAVSKDDYVEMSRSACLGACPSYTVEIKADGTVSWTGKSSVAAIGSRESTIGTESARRLLEKFRTKDFWSYCRSYSRHVTDSGGAEITVQLGGKTRKISDYAASGPKELQDLLLEVDRVADLHHWLH